MFDANSLGSDADWKQPFLVFDLSGMRDVASITAAKVRCQCSDLKMLLPGGAFFEFSNVSEPYATWSGSLKYFADCKDFVCVARKLAQIWKEELRTGEPCTDVVDWRATDFLRSVLQEVAMGRDDLLRALIDGPVQQLIPDSKAMWGESETHKSWITAIYDNFRNTLDEATLKRFRRTPAEALCDWIKSLDGIRFVFNGIKSRGANDATALTLTCQPSVCAGFISAMGLLPLWWLANGGLQDAPVEYLTNDLLDIEYAILGAMSAGLENKDKRQSAICSAIAEGYAARQKWFRDFTKLGMCQM